MKFVSLVAFLGIVGLSARPAGAAPPAPWTKICAKCHGEDGVGKTKMGEKLKVKDLTAPEWQDSKTDADIKKQVREGTKGKMTAVGPDKLSDVELDEIVKFIRGLRRK